MKKISIVILSVVTLVVGVVIGFFLAPQVENSFLNQEQKKLSSKDDIKQQDQYYNSEKTEKLCKSNEFFEFFKKFHSDGEFFTDGAVPKIEFADIYRSIAIISYPFSQEGWKYGVYDYKNNLFYQDFGLIMMDNDEDRTIEAVIGQDTILMLVSSPKDQYFEVVQFRTGQTVKKIPVPLFEQGYSFAFTSKVIYPDDYEGLMVSVVKKNQDNSTKQDYFFIVPKEDYKVMHAREFNSKKGS